MTTKITELDDGSLIKVFIGLRDRRAQRKAAFTDEDSGDKAKQERIEAELLNRFNARNIDNVSARGVGTAYRSTRTSATIADGEAFLDFVKSEDAWELLERRASKAAVEQFISIHGDLPPGVNWKESQVVNVKRN